MKFTPRYNYLSRPKLGFRLLERDNTSGGLHTLKLLSLIIAGFVCQFCNTIAQ